MRHIPQCALPLLLLNCIAAICCASTPPLPSYFSLPSQVQVKSGWTEEDYGEAEFIIIGRDDRPIQRGKHWNAGLTFSGAPDGAEPEAIWAQIKPSLVKGGWTFFRDVPGQPKTARYQKDGHDSWMMLWVNAADDLRLDLVEVGPPTVTLTLKKPAPTPETVSVETGDFPYLAPIPGSTATGGVHDDASMMVEVDAGHDQHEQQFVGSGSITKGYTLPPSLRSTILFVTVYRQALTQAGWSIVREIQGINATDAILSAHYTADGRDIWAMLHAGGEDDKIQVADVSAEDIAKELDRDCHVALYGIHFDFNQATMRPDSQPVLDKVLALLKARPDLKLEVQGHTDNVGGDDYNQKLSEARASAVVRWLSENGVPSARLTARGYGLSMPVADNGSDEGRARNRRVEIRNQSCKARD